MYDGIHYPFRQYVDKPAYIKTLFSEYMKGYLSIRSSFFALIAYVDRLIRLRHAMMYIISYQTNDVRELNGEGKKLLLQHRTGILSEAAFVPVDFKQRVASLSPK